MLEPPRHNQLTVIKLARQHEAAYTRFLSTCDTGLLYHSLAYRDLIQELLDCRANYLISVQGDDVVGALPLLVSETPEGRILNSLPYYGSNGGILATNEQAERALICAYNELAARPTTLSSTLIESPLTPLAAGHLMHNYLDERISHISELPQSGDAFATLLSSIAASARRNVKKAMAHGVRVTCESDRLPWLFEQHKLNMKAIGGPAKSKRFFKGLPKHFREGNDFNVFVAQYNGVPIAALLVFYFNQTVEYYTPAIVAEARSLQPLALIVFTAMVDAAQKGYLRWNWGGTGLHQTGVHRFKKKWATTERRYRYFTQLNDETILQRTAGELLAAYPHFFVVPFHALQPVNEHETGGET